MECQTLRIRANFKPMYFEDTSSIEEIANLHSNWKGHKVGVLCPKCHEGFYLFENMVEDKYGKVRRIWGFCTNCNLNYEECRSVPGE